MNVYAIGMMVYCVLGIAYVLLMGRGRRDIPPIIPPPPLFVPSKVRRQVKGNLAGEPNTKTPKDIPPPSLKSKT